jgi:hypothetical protein
MVGYMRQVKQIFVQGDLPSPDAMFSNRALTEDLEPELW